MARGGGCLKNGCLGCLGLLVLGFVFLGVNALIVMNRSGDERIEDKVLLSKGAAATAPLSRTAASPAADQKPAPGRGWLILELSQGEFHLHPGEPGDGVVVKANYDASTFELAEFQHTWPDSAWVYHVRFRRTISGVQALLRGVMGGNHAAEVHVYVPPDLPLELNLLVKEGGMDAELGGLWLTDVDLRYDKGGIALNLDQPLREAVGSFVVHGRMGGGELAGLGHASPAVLDISCRMGGMSVDLAGNWRNDCDARFDLTMGGMEVVVPGSIDLVRGGDELRRTDAEVARPVLRLLREKVKMGEIEIR